MNLRALLVSVLACAPTAARGDEPPATVPVPPPPTSLDDKAAVMTGEWITSGRSRGPLFGLDLMLGQTLGVRPNLTLYSTEHTSLAVEGFYGAMFTKFGASEAAGAGVRWTMSRGGRDSVTLGPGVDVLFHLNDGKAVVLAPTVDVVWRRTIGERSAFVLGFNAGIGVGLSGYQDRDRDDPVSGKVTPIINFYTGLKF